MDLEYTVRWAGDVHIIKEGEDLLARQQLDRSDGLVQPKCEQGWHEGVALWHGPSHFTSLCSCSCSISTMLCFDSLVTVCVEVGREKSAWCSSTAPSATNTRPINRSAAPAQRNQGYCSPLSKPSATRSPQKCETGPSPPRVPLFFVYKMLLGNRKFFWIPKTFFGIQRENVDKNPKTSRKLQQYKIIIF